MRRIRLARCLLAVALALVHGFAWASVDDSSSDGGHARPKLEALKVRAATTARLKDSGLRDDACAVLARGYQTLPPVVVSCRRDTVPVAHASRASRSLLPSRAPPAF